MPFHTPVCQMFYSCAHTAAAKPPVSVMGQLVQEKYEFFPWDGLKWQGRIWLPVKETARLRSKSFGIWFGDIADIES